DGWGKSPDPKVSAIDNANTPFIDSLYTKYPNASLRTDGLNVGLPEGQMGNSEVGHMNLGAGRIVYQDLVRINVAIENKSFHQEKTLLEAFQYAQNNQKNVHFLGLLSDGGVHSHINHLKGLVDASESFGLKNVFIHAFTDGRDVDPKSGLGFIQDILHYTEKTSVKLASVIGRYYAMDRDKRWERVKLAYDLVVNGLGEISQDVIKSDRSFGLKNVFIHAFTDGRDVDPKSGLGFIQDILHYTEKTSVKLASVIGRYYAMDRDKRWERVKLAYDLVVNGLGEISQDVIK